MLNLQPAMPPTPMGITLTGNLGLITVPQLTITLPEKWDADSAVFAS